MTDIPEDIMQAAKLAVAEWLNEQEGFSSRWERVPDSVEPWLETAWALATVAERERCAKIAEAPRCNTCGAVRQPNSDDCCPWPDLETSNRDDIASAIRSPERAGE